MAESAGDMAEQGRYFLRLRSRLHRRQLGLHRTRPPSLDLGQAAVPGTCSAGHSRPASPLGGWMCPRCGRRIVPFSAEKCFKDHLRPDDLERWTVWVCPEDHEVVVPGDMSRDEIFEANQNHPLIDHRRLPTRFPDDYDSFRTHNVLGVVGVPPTLSTAGTPGTGAEQSADPNERLVTAAAPILAGFSLAAIVVIGTSATLSGRPEALPAMACFAGAAVLLLFSIQLMAIARLLSIRWWYWAGLYELGLLTFLVGLGLFLWPKTWSIAAVFGLSVVGLAIVSDLVLQGVAVCRRTRMPALSDYRWLIK